MQLNVTATVQAQPMVNAFWAHANALLVSATLIVRLRFARICAQILLKAFAELALVNAPKVTGVWIVLSEIVLSIAMDLAFARKHSLVAIRRAGANVSRATLAPVAISMQAIPHLWLNWTALSVWALNTFRRTRSKCFFKLLTSCCQF